MNYKQLPLGPLQTNCYIVWNDQKECLIFDPGHEGNKIQSFLKNEGLKPLAILLTHAHFDHIGAVDNVRELYSIPVYVHEKEAEWLLDPALNGSGRFMGETIRLKQADKMINSENPIHFSSFTLEVFETPGHSPGSVSYYLKERNIVISGDTLFMGSIGRTDLPGGNQTVLMESIHRKLLSLDEETIVLPGHGPETIISQEMDSNPFLNGF